MVGLRRYRFSSHDLQRMADLKVEEMKPTNDITRVALEAAVHMGVSGTLREWPILLRALLDHGAPVGPNTSGLDARRFAREILETRSSDQDNDGYDGGRTQAATEGRRIDPGKASHTVKDDHQDD